MRVLMLGWSFSPRVASGVGAACLGLTRSLLEQGVDVLFLLPQTPQAPSKTASQTHLGVTALRPVDLLNDLPSPPEAASPEASLSKATSAKTSAPAQAARNADAHADQRHGGAAFIALPSWLDSPYQKIPRHGVTHHLNVHGVRAAVAMPTPSPASGLTTQAAPWFAYADTDVLYEQVMQYARQCVEAARGEAFDVVHAHDWMTFPAAAAVAADAGKPLVVHLHSTEVDRSGPGDAADTQIREFERRGMAAADRIIVVSRYAAQLVERHYGVPASRLTIIHNAPPPPEVPPEISPEALSQDTPGQHLFKQLDTAYAGDSVVVFAGRITLQKGARFFVEAAAKLLQRRPQTVFVMAGAGDQTDSIRQQAAREGVADRVLLPGFLPQRELTRLLQRADVFVMPSVSEPFGLAALEAIRAGVPIIISHTSGVAEVVEHALKVDAWDTDQIAAQMLAVLERPQLADELRKHARTEIEHLTWRRAADACMQLYRQLV